MRYVIVLLAALTVWASPVFGANDDCSEGTSFADKGCLFPALIKRAENFYKNGDYDRAIADYDRAISLRDNNPEAHYGRGLAYAKRGDDVHAIADFDVVVDHPSQGGCPRRLCSPTLT